MRYLALLLSLVFWVFTFSISNSVSGASNYQTGICDEPLRTYTVQPEDKLSEIGNRYGSALFWEAIYIANADLIDNPNTIYAGQQFEIPHRIYSFNESDTSLDSVLDQPFCNTDTLPVTSVDAIWLDLYSMDELQNTMKNTVVTSDDTDLPEKPEEDEDMIAAFREAFEAVVSQPDSGEENNRSLKEDEQKESERQLMIEIDGMIHDETRSKVGRDFYDVFYTNWQSPPDAYNFSISISEQPSPSLGTIIYVEVNDSETFRMRLQPRYDFIQQAGQYAVRQTYSYLQNNDHQLQIY